MANMFISIMQKFSWILTASILVFGWYSPILMVLTFICMLAPIVFSFRYGRAWCGNFCPRASFNNSVLSIISYKRDIPKFFKSNIFRIIMFILLMSFFGINIYHTNGNLIKIGNTFLKMMLLTTVIQICLGVLVHPNVWCTFCPMGTAAFYITKFKGKSQVNIKFNKKCLNCGNCKKQCPIQIDVPRWYSYGKVLDADCMKCRKCMNECPGKVLVWSD